MRVLDFSTAIDIDRAMEMQSNYKLQSTTLEHLTFMLWYAGDYIDMLY